MNVWRYQPDIDHYQMIWIVNPDDSERLTLKFLGKRYPGSWSPIAVAPAREWEEKGLPSEQKEYLSSRRTLPLADFSPWPSSSEAIFNDRALKVMLPLIEGAIEVLPLEFEGDRLHLINVISLIDCLDRQRSSIEWLADDIVFRITHYDFKEESLKGQHIFKIPEMLTSIFVSDEFKSRVEENGLQGLSWNPLP
jgi:hypothetical protein